MRNATTQLLVGVMAMVSAQAVYAQTAKKPLEEVIVVFKTHFDIGYTEPAADVLHRYRTSMIDDALAIIEQSKDLPPERQFKWTVPGWPLERMLEDWDGQTPERQQRILDALKSGRLVVHALPFTLHTEAFEPEDLVRGFGYASRLCRELGFELPRDAKMTDVPSHSWILPALLRRAGVDFLQLGCNPGSSSPDLPILFWWESPDGSRLLTMYTAGNYGTGVVPPKDWPYPVWLALMMTGDNQGPPKPEAVDAVLKEAANALPANVKVRFGRLSDFSDALLKHNVELPIIRGDMPDTWIHGVMSMPVESGAVRNWRPLIPALESLNTLNRAWGVAIDDARATVAAAYEHSLQFGEHTWGMDAKDFDHTVYGDEWKRRKATGHYAKMEQSWRDKGADALAVRDIVSKALDENLRALASSINVSGKRVVVFNPLPWKRDGFVELADTTGIPTALQDVKTKKRIAVEAQAGKVGFLARDVPAMGYRTYAYAETKDHTPLADTTGNVIENKYLKVTLDPTRGGVTSIINKQTGAELVDASNPFAFGQYLYERFSQNEMDRYLAEYDILHVAWTIADFGHPGLPPAGESPYRTETAQDMTLEIRQTETSASAILCASPTERLPHEITLTVTLYRETPYVDFTWAISDKPEEPMPEAGWLCLPFNVANPSFKLARLGGIVDIAKDVVRSSNHDVYCLNGGAAILANDGTGAAFCPLDSPLVSFERPGLWRFSRDFIPSKPVAFVNLYNNVWGVNFQQWTGGSWQSRVRVWAVQSGHLGNALVTPSDEARVPLLAAVHDGPAGTLPPAQAGLQLPRKGVLVTAFGPNPDAESPLSRELVLRLWEQTGRGGTCDVTLPDSVDADSVTPCDLRGRPTGEPIPVRRHSFELQLEPFAPASVVLLPLDRCRECR